MVMSWILHPVSQEIKSSIMYLDSAATMWNELNHEFDQGNGPRIFEMNETLITLHQGHDSVSAYFTKLKAIWDEIAELRPRTPCTCAASADSLAFHNQDQVLQFLTGLNESFHVVCAQILLIDPFPSLSKVSMVAQEERLRKLGPSYNTTPMGASTSAPNSNQNPSSRNKKIRPTCSHCHKPCHLKDKCYFLHGFPPIYGNRKPNVETPGQNVWKNHIDKPVAATSQVLQDTTKSNASSITTHCQQLISLLSQQLQRDAPPSSSEQPVTTIFIVFDLILTHRASKKKFPFISNNNFASTVFDLIHMDIWGPYQTLSIEGYRYFLTIVDDKSRYTWIYMLKLKFDASTVIQKNFTLIYT
ncbi:uncharacterized protein LOC133799937 [Humulus lupulus]|uniref:uncharacterized protein LOC133799937 n=1 Tax=Humulus lupulus TaxID=3486 RepID=UPI002B4133A5|nr:uncharacterized protein LOC133799937 [Humulus lupulus]